MNPFEFDAFEFCRLKQSRESTHTIAELPRLVKECASGAGEISWSLAGAVDQLGHSRLSLKVSGSVELICQRCLKTFEYGIVSQSVLVLAHDDAAADEIESLLDDDELDVIVAPKILNAQTLIEDEILLALPAAPKHDVCPDSALIQKSESVAGKVSPFAVLKDWKR